MALDGLEGKSDRFLEAHFAAWSKGRGRLRRNKKVEAHKEQVTEDWGQFQLKIKEVARLIDSIDDANEPAEYREKLKAAERMAKENVKNPDIKGGRQKLDELKNEILIVLRKQEAVSIEQRDEFREKRAKEEIQSLNLAINARQERIGEIKDEIKGAFGQSGALATRALLMQEYEEAKAQLAALSDRKEFLKAYSKDKKGRAQNAEVEQDLLDRTNSRNKRLERIDSKERAEKSKTLAEFGANSDRIQEIAATPTAADDAAALHEKLSELFERDSQMILHSNRMYPDEPPITVISAEQFGALGQMLDAAKSMLDKGLIAEAFAVLEKAQKRHMEFRQVRAYTPEAKVEKPVDTEAILKRRLADISAGLVELWAAENKDHGWFENRHAELSAVFERLVAGQLDDGEIEKLVQDVTTLAGQVEDAVKRQSGGSLSPAAQKSVEAAEMAAADFLGKYYTTKEIKDGNLVEDPAKTYTAEERAKLIPLDRLVRVPDLKSPTKFRLVEIDTKKDATGKEVSRREGTNVPREMLDMLNKRAATLHMMKENADAGSSEAVRDYAKETERLTIELGNPENIKKFNDIEKAVKAIEKELNRKPVTEFAPTAVHKLKEDFNAFKDSWRTKSPTKSLDEVTELESRKDEVVERSEALKALHKEFDKKTLELIKSSSKLMELFSGFDLKAQIAKTSKEWRASDAGKKAIQQINDCAAALKKGEKGLNTYHGEWMKEMDVVRQLLTNKSEGAIVEVEGKMGALKHKVHNYERMMTGFTEKRSALDKQIKQLLGNNDVVAPVFSKSGAEMEAYLEKLGAEMQASKEGLDADKKAKADFEAHKKTAEDHLSDVKKIIKKKGDKLQNKELFTNRCDAIKRQVEALEAQVEESLDYELGKTKMEEHKDEAEELLDLANGQKRQADKTDGKTNIVTLVKQLRKRRRDLIAAAKGLKAVIEAKGKDPVNPPDTPPDQMSTEPEHIAHQEQIDKIDTMMQQLDGKIASLQAVEDAGGKLDKFDSGAQTNREGKRIREEALAEFRKFEAAIDADPLLEVYRTNPFESGKAFLLFREAMHSAQVAIAASVNPKRK